MVATSSAPAISRLRFTCSAPSSGSGDSLLRAAFEKPGRVVMHSPGQKLVLPEPEQLAQEPMHRVPELCRRLLVSLAVLLELSVRNTPSLMFEIWQRSALTTILKVVPPFWRRNLPMLSTTQFEMFSVEAALICANLSSPLKPETPEMFTVPEDLMVNASSPTFVQRKFCRLPPL